MTIFFLVVYAGLMTVGAVADYLSTRSDAAFDRHADQAIDLTGGHR